MSPLAHGDIKPSQVESQLKSLRSSDQKPAAIVKLATDIRSLITGIRDQADRMAA